MHPLIGRFEQGSQSALCATRCCVHRDPVPADDIGDLIPIHADDVPKHEHRTLIGCQLRHRCSEARVGVETRWEFRFDTDLRDRRSEMLGATRFAPQLVETRETDTSEQPRPEGTTVTLGVRSGLDEFEECLLHRVLGEALIVHHAVGE